MPRLSLAQLDAIPYVTETGAVLDPTRWERTEQLIAAEFVRSDHQVLELGGCYGLVSCVINHNLQDPSRHVVVEPCVNVLPALIGNRDSHQALFHVYCGVVARKAAVVKGDGLGRWTEPASDGDIPHVTVDVLQKHYGLEFNCLVADCEGALQQFVEDFPDLLDQLDTFLFERDREWDAGAALCNYAVIEDRLREKGFDQVRGGPHPIWKRKSSC